jgi:hypothetical protein
VTDSLARALATLVVAIVGAGAGTGCGGSTDMSRQGAGTGTTGTGGGNPTAGGQGGPSGAVDPAAAPGSTLFAQQYGDDQQQTLNGLAVDAAGNTYVVGTETPQGIQSAFVLQYDATGELRWRQPFVPDADFSYAQVAAVAVQPTTGAVILAGFLAGNMTAEGTRVSSTIDPLRGRIPNLWLTALDKAGYLVWTKVFSSPASVFPTQVFVTGSGDIEVIGTTLDNATVGGGPLCCTGPDLGESTFVARFSPTGDHLWSRAFGGRFFLAGGDTDAAGGLVIGGSISGTATFDGQTFVSGGSTPDGGFVINGQVFRLDPDGHNVWAETMQASQQIFPGARLAPGGDVILFGSFRGDVDLGNGQHLSFAPPLDYLQGAFLAELNPDGAAQWARALPPVGTAFVDTGNLAIDAAGNLVFAGRTENGGASLAGVAGQDDTGIGDFIAKYAPDGSYLWSRAFAVQIGEGGPPLVAGPIDPSGDVSAAGNFDNTVDFGTGPLTAPGVLTLPGRGAPAPHIPDNVFVLRLAP